MSHLSLPEQIADLPEPIRRLFACTCAERVLPFYEQLYLQDTRLRETITVARQFALGQTSARQLREALAVSKKACAEAKEQALALKEKCWLDWRTDPRQVTPPPISLELDLSGGPWVYRLEEDALASGWAATWIQTDHATRLRWALLHAAWYAAEAACRTVWQDTNYSPAVRTLLGEELVLTNTAYAQECADFAARCPTEAAAQALLEIVPTRFFPYYGSIAKIGPSGLSAQAGMYKRKMEMERRKVMVQELTWQQAALKQHREHDQHLAQNQCNDSLNRALTKLIQIHQDQTTVDDALRALQALACPLDLVALVKATPGKHWLAQKHIYTTVKSALEAHQQDVNWFYYQQQAIAPLLLQYLETKNEGDYIGCAELLCLLNERRAIDILCQDFKQKPGKQGNIAAIIGYSGLSDAAHILETFLPESKDDHVRRSIALAYVKAAGAQAVDFILTQIYPHCNSQSRRELLNIIRNIRTPGVVERWIANLEHPDSEVKKGLLYSLRHFDYPKKPVSTDILESVARLVENRDRSVAKLAVDTLMYIGYADALSLLELRIASYPPEIQREIKTLRAQIEARREEQVKPSPTPPAILPEKPLHPTTQTKPNAPPPQSHLESAHSKLKPTPKSAQTPDNQVTVPDEFIPLENRKPHISQHGDKISCVTYYHQPLPHTTLLQEHLAAYPGIPAKILLPQVTMNGVIQITEYHYDVNVQPQSFTETYIDEKSEHYLREIIKDAAGNLIKVNEFDYDELTGELQVVRTRNPAGKIICEDFL